MPYRKTAIAVPAEVLAEVDKVARSRGESRSKFITRILRAALKARRDADIVRRLNEVFSDEAVSHEQRETEELFDKFGTSWEDERW